MSKIEFNGKTIMDTAWIEYQDLTNSLTMNGCTTNSSDPMQCLRNGEWVNLRGSLDVDNSGTSPVNLSSIYVDLPGVCSPSWAPGGATDTCYTVVYTDTTDLLVAHIHNAGSATQLVFESAQGSTVTTISPGATIRFNINYIRRV